MTDAPRMTFPAMPDPPDDLTYDETFERSDNRDMVINIISIS